MARTKTTTEPIVPTPAEVEAANNEAARAVVRADAAREMAASERQANMMALAGQIGYMLPEGISFDAVAADVRLHLQLHEQHQQAADESLFRVGIGLMVLREGCARGEFAALCESFGFSRRHGNRLVDLTNRFTDCNNVSDLRGKWTPVSTFPRLTEAAGNLRKLAELTAFSDEELQELEETGEVLGVTLDDISRASARKLRDILKRARAREQAANDTAERLRDQLDRANREIEAQHRLLGEKSLEIEKLKRRDDGTGDNAAAFEDAIATLHARARGVRLAVAQMEDAAQTAMRHGDCLLLTAACVQMQIQALREIQGNMALPLLPDTDLPRFEQQVMLGRAAEYMADRDEDADAAWGDDDGQE